jgi:hypothetical protein
MISAGSVDDGSKRKRCTSPEYAAGITSRHLRINLTIPPRDDLE